MSSAFIHPINQKETGAPLSGWTNTAYSGEREVRLCAAFAPETGVYRVTVHAEAGAKLFSTRRNAVSLRAPGGDFSFLTHRTEFYPQFSPVLSDDLNIYAASVGGAISNMRIEPANARTVFVAGDSTATDQTACAPYCPFDSHAGWGQMLPLFLPGDAVCNQAHSGLTARSFVLDGHFDIVKANMKPGDLLLIQFGHNDQKRRALQPQTEYPEWLSRIAREAMALGGVPVMLSSISRLPGFDAGGAFSALTAHAECAGRTAKALGIPFIDLHAHTFARWLALGEGARDYFKPGDATHTNDYGAYEIARYVAQALNALGLADPVFPDAPFSPDLDRALSPVKPAPSRLPAPYRDLSDEEDPAIVSEGVKQGLLDPCVMYMQPRLPLPRAQFVQMLFRAARISTRATDGNAPYPDVFPREFDAPYAMAFREMRLSDEPLYRPDDPITRAEAESVCARAHFPADFSGADGVPTKYQLVRALLKGIAAV